MNKNCFANFAKQKQLCQNLFLFCKISKKNFCSFCKTKSKFLQIYFWFFKISNFFSIQISLSARAYFWINYRFFINIGCDNQKLAHDYEENACSDDFEK
jgi:hypothetical protein